MDAQDSTDASSPTDSWAMNLPQPGALSPGSGYEGHHIIYPHAPSVNLNVGTNQGVAVGINYGTINATNVTVASSGTTLNAASPPSLKLLKDVPYPPAGLLNFLDRTQVLQDIRSALQPDRRAWIHGCPGCGLSALLLEAANDAATKTFTNGVGYVDGKKGPCFLNDVIQELFLQFYVGSETVKVPTQNAITALSSLNALFLFDQLELKQLDDAPLADIGDVAGRLRQGAVLVAADDPPSGNLLDVPLDGLPRSDALALCADTAGIEPNRPELVALLDEICAALHDMPISLVLVGHWIRAMLAQSTQERSVGDQPDSAHGEWPPDDVAILGTLRTALT